MLRLSITSVRSLSLRRSFFGSRPSSRFPTPKDKDELANDAFSSVSPSLQELLMNKSTTEADLERFVRNMTPEDLQNLISSKAFQQHINESKSLQQEQQFNDSENLAGRYPWMDDLGEGEGEGGWNSWQDFEDYKRQDALREAKE